MESDGWSVRWGRSADCAWYSTAQETDCFGWEGVRRLRPPGLARTFVEKFAAVAQRGNGPDAAYADWFAGMMETAETGRLPIFGADYEIDLSHIRVPPPPEDRAGTKR